jgi:beta-galactosidase
VTTVGTVPDRALGAALGRHLAATSLPADPWRDARPETVTVHRAMDGEGRLLHVVHNWSWEAAGLSLPADVVDIVGGEPLAAGSPLELGAWDVRVVREAGTPA